MENIKKLRDQTEAGIMECKKALAEANGDFDRAVEILRERGLSRASKRAERVASQGLVETYIHGGGRIGAMIELNCETDFVARTDSFKALAHDIAMQVAATSPRYLSKEEVPADVTDPVCEIVLLEQPFIKDPGRTIQDRINDLVVTTGEKVELRRFCRFELGGL
jgi:elongation factor Ts